MKFFFPQIHYDYLYPGDRVRAYNKPTGGNTVKEVRVLLVEDDFYACNLMELLLRRDWRTKIVGEVNYAVDLSKTLEDMKKHSEGIDLVVIDTDISSDPTWLSEVLRSLAKHNPEIAILFTGVVPNNQIAQLRSSINYAGYILKGEICYSLAWAVAIAAEGHMVVTPGVCDLFVNANPLPAGTRILDGRELIVPFSDLEKRRSRMVFIFSMERHEFADEEDITEDFSYGVVSALYEKLGVNDILNGEENADEYFRDYPVVMSHLKQTLDHLKNTKSKKAIDKETLAFHLLTMPKIDIISL
jgi:DNA-binding NarL/FixJ family response regulator